MLLLKGVASVQLLTENRRRASCARWMYPSTAARPPTSTASIGISLYPQDAKDAKGLLKHADEAMYRAKQSGGNRFTLHGQATR